MLSNRKPQNTFQENYSRLGNKSFEIYNSQPIRAANERNVPQILGEPFDSERYLDTAYTSKNHPPSNDVVNNILTRKLISILNQQNNESKKTQERSYLESDIKQLMQQIHHRKTIEEQILEKRVQEQLKSQNSQVLLDKIIQAFNKGYEMRQKEVE